jgi:diguanylate cyclase (GGDEF)-like protein
MSTQPILVVIGIAIAVNLVIMGALMVTLIVRRRSRLATPDGYVAPAPYRNDAMTASRPTATSPITFVDDDPEDEYDRESEESEDDVSATDPSERRFRPMLSDEGQRVENTTASFLTGGSTNAVPPTPTPAPAAPAPLPAPTPIAPRPAPALAPRPTPVASAAPRPAPDPTRPAANGSIDWETRVREEDARLTRYRRPVSVVLVELEGMDRLVERFGLDAAERIVPPVGQTLARQARASDQVTRISTSRFAVLLPETDEVQAINYVERVRAECDRWLAAGAVSMRLAIGWASPTPGSDLRTATRVAEDRLNADRRRMITRLELGTDPTMDMDSAVELTPPDGAE